MFACDMFNLAFIDILCLITIDWFAAMAFQRDYSPTAICVVSFLLKLILPFIMLIKAYLEIQTYL